MLYFLRVGDKMFKKLFSEPFNYIIDSVKKLKYHYLDIKNSYKGNSIKGNIFSILFIIALLILFPFIIFISLIYVFLPERKRRKI